MNTEIYESSEPLPLISESSTKDTVVNAVKEYAKRNGFEVVIARSTAHSAHLKCKKGGAYKNVRNLSEDDRKSYRNTCRIQCPFYIRIGTKKDKGLTYLSHVSNDEKYHNHEINDENLLSTSAGRKSLLDLNDMEELQRGIEQKLPSKMIQKILSSESDHNKLTIHDINNLKYTMIDRVDINGADGGTDFMNYIESHGFIVEHYCNPTSGDIKGIFFTSPSLLDRARRFPEVVLIDATYNTNDIKLPLICAFGVSNLGKETLKTFPIAFSWVSSEKEKLYEWFVKTFKDVVGRCLDNTIFVTDKCIALINQLDEQFPENKKLLCTWHMIQNMNTKATLDFFVNTTISKQFKDKVFAMFYCSDDTSYSNLRTTVYQILSNSSNFVSSDAQISFNKYYKNEWEKYTERWAGHITSKYKHLGCTTTQRAESGHSSLKSGMSSLQPLDLSFDKIRNNLLNFERGYNDIERKEKNEVDILVNSEPRLKSLIGKVAQHALISIRCELLRDEDDVAAPCNCHSKICYGLPCCHELYGLEKIELSRIPTRWWLKKPELFYDGSSIATEDKSDESENEADITLTEEPWMKYVANVERAFRFSINDPAKQLRLMSALDGVLSLAGSSSELSSIEKLSLSLPDIVNVKYPGRPKKIKRLSALKKDYAKKGAKFRRNKLIYGKHKATNILEKELSKKKKKVVSKKSNRKIKKTIFKKEVLDVDKYLEEAASLDFDIEETLRISNDPAFAPQKGLFISKKRKCMENNIDIMLGREKRHKIEPGSSDPAVFLHLHDSIDIKNVDEVYDPIGDGHCGYRALAFLHYGDEKQFKDVKRDMLKTLEINKDIYVEFLAYDITTVEKNIKSGLDENSDGMPIWFKTPYCAQIAADTYDVPVCVYNSTFPLTFLPIKKPVEPKLRISPYILQNISNTHWLAVKFSHLRTTYPDVDHFYFHIDKSYVTLFKKTWNHFGQFPKYVESRPFNPQTDELIPVLSSDEE